MRNTKIIIKDAHKLFRHTYWDFHVTSPISTKQNVFYDLYYYAYFLFLI